MQSGFPSQKISNAERIPISWHITMQRNFVIHSSKFGALFCEAYATGGQDTLTHALLSASDVTYRCE